MVISVFYSWQSEHPECVNHYFIRDALKEAMKVIQRKLELEERPEVDHDTKGTPGLPEIVHTIFSKIEISSAFVADVSFTSESTKGRLCANANVLIELGFALHSLGSERLILVMNDAFGSPAKQMPFNLASRRWPITYTLAPNADKETRKKVSGELSGKLAYALEVMADSGILFSTPATSSWIRSDRLLFRKLLEQFPYNSHMIYLLREWDVAEPFEREWLAEIDRFTQKWNNALHEFINPTLESKRKDFMQKLTSFQNELWSNTWSWGSDGGLRSMNLDEFNDKHPRWKKRDELNVMGTEAHDAHQELVRACKTMLGHPEAS
ncbi:MULTISPECIES: hypothetical protein [unclassified Microcoleus]|uniref:hypothetical protein n=1 Tax=unclassified Microcoleus TaxID=2642155 RepID=UPI002FCF53AF